MRHPDKEAFDMTVSEIPQVRHRFVDVEGLQIFYRETGPPGAPTMLLLYGFPSASHQFRRLLDALGSRYRLVALDCPGFRHNDDPDGEHFTYSFEHLADVLEGFIGVLGLRRFALYLFDFGGPIGFRVATRHPERITGLAVQNANAYEEGISELARGLIANRPGVPGAADAVRQILVLPVTRSQYEDGTTDPSLVAPDRWTLDQHFLDRPGRKDIQAELALDYHTNIKLYPVWQEWLRAHQPPILIVWGRGDAFFGEAGAHAYLRDVPRAKVHLFDTGHFALEEKLSDIAPLIDNFLRDIERMYS
jgi:pimeloyl-ACP methyl ester carboxylesterase